MTFFEETTVNYLPVLCLALLAMAPVLVFAESDITHVDVLTSGQDGYACYRIPTIEVAPDGTILAFAEARKYNGGDPGMDNNEIDLVLKRSADGGRTWSAMKVIEHAGERWSSANAATVVDRKTKRVWVLYLRCKPNRDTGTSRPGTDDTQTLARHSDDCGVTWSEPTDLTAIARDMADPKWTCSVIGPGGAIQTRKGRLLFASWKATPYVPFCLHSDDHGKTWRRSAMVPGVQGGNECQVVELADGRILMDIRQNDGPSRWVSISEDGGTTWSSPRPGATVSPVACAIERLTRKAGRERDRIAWTGPRGPARKTLVARVSYDEGETYSNERLVYDGLAAYSDLALLRGASLGVLWERDDYRHITFTRLTMEFLEPK